MNFHSSISTDSWVWRWIEDQLMEFDQRWNRNEPVAIAGFIESLDWTAHSDLRTAPRAQLIAELIKIEMEYRWRASQGEIAESYFVQFPDLENELKEGIIEAELVARCIAGTPPTLNELQSRFPDDSAKWNQLVEKELVARENENPSRNSQTSNNHEPAKSSPVSAQGMDSVLQPGDRLGKYQLIRERGRGSFAVVWLARDTQLDRQVALKLIDVEKQAHDPTVLPRLMREAKIVALVDHPGIVEVFEVGEHAGRNFIVEQYIEGSDLATKIQEGLDSDLESGVTIVRDMALAVHAAHECGIVHRDIKPANILIDQDGAPFLVDFGLAQLENMNEATLTQQGDMLGTPAYMSPEQALGEHDRVDGRTDVYSLGAVLFHLVSGHIPFEGSALTVLDSVIRRPASTLFKELPRIPKDLKTIIVRCMEKDPESRYRSASLLADDLTHLLRGEPIQARPVSSMERTVKWIRRRPRTACALALTVILVAGLIGSLGQLQNVSHQKRRADRLKERAEREVVQKAIVAGQLAMQRGQMNKAAQLLQPAIEQSQSRDPEVMMDLVECLIATRKIKSADQVLGTLNHRDMTDQERGRSKLIEAQLELQKPGGRSRSESLFLESLEGSLTTGQRHFAEAMLAERSRDSVALLQEALVADPLHHPSHRMLAVLQFSLADFVVLEKHLEQTLLLFPDDIDFRLLQIATLSCTGKLARANSQLTQMELSDEEQGRWRSICECLNRICTEYSHYEGESTDFTLAAMSEIAKDYMQTIHPEFVRRGFQFPPRIAQRFTRVVGQLQQSLGLVQLEKHMVSPIEELTEIHPDASLFCWLGGMHIKSGELSKAKEAFRKATGCSSFIVESNGLCWQGLFTCCAAQWQRGVDVDQQLKDGVQAILEIEKDSAAVKKYTSTASFSRAVIFFLVDAVKAGHTDAATIKRWLNWTEERGTITQANRHWIQAIVAKADERYVEALKQLELLEAIDPDGKAVPADQVEALRGGLRKTVQSIK